jgi:hypothetical protein
MRKDTPASAQECRDRGLSSSPTCATQNLHQILKDCVQEAADHCYPLFCEVWCAHYFIVLAILYVAVQGLLADQDLVSLLVYSPLVFG